MDDDRSSAAKLLVAEDEAAPPSGTAKRRSFLPTPECLETESNIEGPFYTPNAPYRSRLTDPLTEGTRLVIEGHVRSTDRTLGPLRGAHLDVWQADTNGAYDLVSFTLRGQLTADEHGAFRIETIVPGRYLDGAEYRPRHIHVKVTAEGHDVLTTQLYFADDPYNAGDPYFLPTLVMEPNGANGATFHFVLRRTRSRG